MKITKKYAAVTGAILIVGALFSGAAFAASSTGDSAATAQSGKRVSQLSAGAQATWQELSTLRKAAMEKLKSDSQALVGDAVKSGKITQEEADQLLAHGGKGGEHGMRGEHGRPGPGKLGHKGMGGPGGRFATQEEFKAHLDAEVKAGKHTQEEADKLLQEWSQKQAPSNKN